MIRQSGPLQVAMVAWSCVGVSRVTMRLQFARIAGQPVRRGVVHLHPAQREGGDLLNAPGPYATSYRSSGAAAPAPTPPPLRHHKQRDQVTWPSGVRQRAALAAVAYIA
jgi:hypothetical protein